MSRKKQTILFIIIGLAMVFGYTRILSRHFTAEAAFFAFERGWRYGPSTEIIQEIPLLNGELLMVGRLDDGLSFACVERKFFGLWGTGGEYLQGPAFSRNLEDDTVFVDVVDAQHILGYVRDNQVEQVRCVARSYYQDSVMFECTIPCQDGYFYQLLSEPIYMDQFFIEIYDGDTLLYTSDRMRNYTSEIMIETNDLSEFFSF